MSDRDPRRSMGPVDADVAAARTPDGRCYPSQETFAMARERVFARSWQWIGDLDAVREHSSLSPRTLLPGFLDEPLLLALDRVEIEDQSIVEAVQRGVSSRLYRGGRYSVAHERGVHHFHRLLTAAWAEAPG